MLELCYPVTVKWSLIINLSTAESSKKEEDPEKVESELTKLRWQKDRWAQTVQLSLAVTLVSLSLYDSYLRLSNLSWGLCYKIYYGRNLRIFVISVCPWQEFTV